MGVSHRRADTRRRAGGVPAVRDIGSAAVGVEAYQEAPRVDFPDEVSRIYFDAPAEARLIEAGREGIVRKTGFADAVVWNPGTAKCATMADLEPEDYRRFVCVEAAAVGAPIRLASWEHWQGSQTLRA